MSRFQTTFCVNIKVPKIQINGNERGEKGQKIRSKNRLWKEIFDRFRICNKCSRMRMGIVNEKRIYYVYEATIQIKNIGHINTFLYFSSFVLS